MGHLNLRQLRGKNVEYIPSFTLLLLLNLAQSVVAWSQEEKCGLKYVIQTSGGLVWTSDNHACIMPAAT